jgi:hypothetical protein
VEEEEERKGIGERGRREEVQRSRGRSRRGKRGRISR